jgi:hypothetical protein
MSLSVYEALDRLCDVEARRDLLRYEVDGWSAWPLIRFEVSLLQTGMTFPHRQPTSRAERALRALNDVPALLFVKHARHLVRTYCSGLVEPVNGRFRDMWLDDVLLATGSVFKIEVANSPRFTPRSRKAAIKRNVSGAAIDLASALLAGRSPRPDVLSAAREFGRAVRDDLGLPAIDDPWIIRRLSRFVAAKRVYRSIVRRVGPAFVLIVDPGEHALVAAAKEQGCSVLEFQHGIADSSNPSYMWPASAKAYRPRMPIPDRILLYGEHWRRELDRDGFWGDALRVVGSPRLDRYRAQAVQRSGERCSIVFTTQGLEIQAVTAFLRAALQSLANDVPFRLQIKLHPIHDSDPQPYRDAFAAFGDRVEVLAGDEGASTYELLRRADLHVSIASASHYEAVGLGVPTVILPFKTHEIVLPMQRAGHAYFAATPDDLASLLRKWQNLKPAAEVSEYYFRPGARANILRELALESSSMS